jgi:hypothetical protein
MSMVNQDVLAVLRGGGVIHFCSISCQFVLLERTGVRAAAQPTMFDFLNLKSEWALVSKEMTEDGRRIFQLQADFRG